MEGYTLINIKHMTPLFGKTNASQASNLLIAPFIIEQDHHYKCSVSL